MDELPSCCTLGRVRASATGTPAISISGQAYEHFATSAVGDRAGRGAGVAAAGDGRHRGVAVALIGRRVAAGQFGFDARLCGCRHRGGHRRGGAALPGARRATDVPGLRSHGAGRPGRTLGSPRLSPARAVHDPGEGNRAPRAASRHRDRDERRRALAQRLPCGHYREPAPDCPDGSGSRARAARLLSCCARTAGRSAWRWASSRTASLSPNASRRLPPFGGAAPAPAS